MIQTKEATFPKYPAYKDSGVEWLGEIPEGWEVKKLKFTGYIYPGISGKKGDDFSKEYAIGFKPFIPFTNICNNHKISENHFQFARIDENENQNRVLKNDILFLMSSETLDDIAKCSIYLGNSEELYLNSFCKGFRITKSNICPEYVNYLLTSSYYRNYFSLVGRGFTRVNLKQEFIKDAFICLPPLPEQTRIAAFLDDKTTKIDRAIAQKEQLIALLKERKQIVIQDAVTGQLKMENGEWSMTPKEKLKDSGVEWIGEIPEGWDIIALNFVIDAVGDVDHYMPPTIDEGIPYLITGDLKEFVSNVDFDGCKKVSSRDYINLTKKIKTEKGDVILARYATIGTSTYVDIDTKFLVSYSCVTIKPKRSKLFGLFLFYFFKTNVFATDIKNQINTNTQGNVGIGDLKKVKLILPPLKEQTAIVAHIEAQSGKIDQAIALQQTQIEKLKEYKASLIDGAVTGKIKVSEL